MLAAALSAVNGTMRHRAPSPKCCAPKRNDITAQKLRRRSRRLVAAAAAVAAVHCYFHDPTGLTVLRPLEPPLERIQVQAATDSVAALADLAAAGGAARTAVIQARAAGKVKQVLVSNANANEQNKYAPLYIQVCRLAGNLCFGGAYNWFNFVDLFVNVALTAEDATSFRWAARHLERVHALDHHAAK